MLQVNHEDVVAAGKVLFGPAFRADEHAWRVDLKTTYRRRALETHPDRARAVGRSETDLALEFRRVTDAYRFLSELTAGPLADSDAEPPPTPPRTRPPPTSHRSAHAPGPQGQPSSPPPRTSPPPRAEPPSARSERQAQRPPASPPPGSRPRAAAADGAARSTAPGGAPASAASSAQVEVPGHRVRYGVQPEAMPHRKLRFAEFLYYSGRVPWNAFVESIAWQRRQRPPIGRLAVEWGFLQPEDVGRIMEERRARGAQQIPFGEFAVRMGYLTPFQVLALLGRQQRMQRRIGEYFVEHGFVEASELEELRRRQDRHNARWKE